MYIFKTLEWEYIQIYILYKNLLVPPTLFECQDLVLFCWRHQHLLFSNLVGQIKRKSGGYSDLNSAINILVLSDIYIMLYSTMTKYTFTLFSNLHGNSPIGP